MNHQDERTDRHFLPFRNCITGEIGVVYIFLITFRFRHLTKSFQFPNAIVRFGRTP